MFRFQIIFTLCINEFQSSFILLCINVITSHFRIKQTIYLFHDILFDHQFELNLVLGICFLAFLTPYAGIGQTDLGLGPSSITARSRTQLRNTLQYIENSRLFVLNVNTHDMG